MEDSKCGELNYLFAAVKCDCNNSGKDEGISECLLDGFLSFLGGVVWPYEPRLACATLGAYRQENEQGCPMKRQSSKTLPMEAHFDFVGQYLFLVYSARKVLLDIIWTTVMFAKTF